MALIDAKIGQLRQQEEESATENRAKQLGLPYINLVSYPIPDNVLLLLSPEDAADYKLAPFKLTDKKINFAALEPESERTKGYAETIAAEKGLAAKLFLASKTSIAFGLGQINQATGRKRTPVQAEVQEDEIVFQGLADFQAKLKLATTSDLLDRLFEGAIHFDASDIHLEPGEKKVRIRYRVDGVLEDIANLSVEIYKGLLSRIKFLGKLKIDLKVDPQDGRFSVKRGGKIIDIRLSTLPSQFGEAVVMRLLRQDLKLLSLDDLGFRKEALSTIRQAIVKPNGLILNTGPTGSGKTTTLYAVLRELNQPGQKIITLEDPIEYRIEGIEQSQIEPEKNYDFPTGLRAILRQDPDIIMIGEIRDQESATIALNAALTGHLVLSTLHTNSAPAALPRLLEMGIRSFLLSGSINLIIAQRLIRRLCEQCKERYRPSEAELNQIAKIAPELKPEFLYQPSQCDRCLNGYRGRIAIIETLTPGRDLNRLIGQMATIAEFEAEAKKEGMTEMVLDGLAKAAQGLTSLEELWRVT